MPFRQGYSANEQGIDTKKAFVVSVKGDEAPVGTRVSLVRDDLSNCPYFADATGRQYCLWWHHLDYADNKLIKNSMYPKTSRAAAEEIEILEKRLAKEVAKRAAATQKVNDIEAALNKLRNL